MQVINDLRNVGADICFLQEAHLSHSDLQHFHYYQFDHIFTVSCNCLKTGVLILINKKIPLAHYSSIIDPDGRCMIINTTINSTILHLLMLTFYTAPTLMTHHSFTLSLLY